MGIAQAMGENMKKNMDAQKQFQKELILKQRQTQLAVQIAMSRQTFKYFSGFYYTVATICTLAFIKTKNPKVLIPLIPFSFVYAFQYDMCYGNMMERAMKQADTLIVENPYKFYLPDHSGIVSIAEYEKILRLKPRPK